VSCQFWALLGCTGVDACFEELGVRVTWHGTGMAGCITDG
jgi:hypothetical protein